MFTFSGNRMLSPQLLIQARLVHQFELTRSVCLSSPSHMSSNVPHKRGRGAKGGSVHTGPFSVTSVPWSADRKLITQAAVKQSLVEGAFVDTKFYVFSRRRSSGVVDKPMALYTNSAILTVSSKYFEGCESLCFC